MRRKEWIDRKSFYIGLPGTHKGLIHIYPENVVTAYKQAKGNALKTKSLSFQDM